MVGVLGALQAMEAIKILSGFGDALRGRLLQLDLSSMDITTLKLAPRPDCPDCAAVQRKAAP